MDTLSHALWGKGLFGYRKHRWYSFLFGALPDLFSFGIYFIHSIFFSSSPVMGRPTRSEIPEWVYSLYDISHSMVIASIIIFIVYKINKEFAFPMLAWPAHIILDFFTHSIEFFPTPILWPISDFKFDGIPWSNPIIFFTNVLLIFLLFIYRRKKASSLQKS
ncbi:MAG: hypothetical protein P8K72_04745 [Flavobacteriaceae bacterium]|nr:hypothetical protein [Flavobacteriaceae bacterium]